MPVDKSVGIGGAGHPKTKSRNLVTRTREMKAFELRKAGASYGQIGEKLGISKQQANALVRAVLADLIKMTHEEALEVRKIERDRLDAMLLGVWARAKKGDDEAVNTVLKIMSRRSSLDGLDSTGIMSSNFSGVLKLTLNDDLDQAKAALTKSDEDPK